MMIFVTSTVLLHLLGLTFQISAKPTFSKHRQYSSPAVSTFDNILYDAIIVGGGPAGLSALSSLGRVRRTALLIDSGEYRNSPTRNIHDVIGSDGISPAAFRARAREQITRYPNAFLRNGTVTSITRSENNSSFLTTISSGQTFRSRRIILATGVEDVIPSTPGFGEAWGNGMFWCIWCDNWEHRDQPIGIIKNLVPNIVSTVLSVRPLNKDIVVFLNGTDTPAARKKLDSVSPGWQAQLERLGAKIENRTITAIERVQDGSVVKNKELWHEYDLFQVHLEDGATILRGAFLISLKNHQRSYLGEKIGVRLIHDRIGVDPSTMKAAPGVWGVGDANNDSVTSIPHALYTGKKSAVDVHYDLIKESKAQLSLSRRSEIISEETENDLEILWNNRHRLA